MIARVETEDPNPEDKRTYYHYYDAHEFNSIVLKNNTLSYFHASNEHNDPGNNIPIKNIDYFMVNKESPNKAIHAASYHDFIMPGERWNALFPNDQWPVPPPTLQTMASDVALRRRRRHFDCCPAEGGMISQCATCVDNYCNSMQCLDCVRSPACTQCCRSAAQCLEPVENTLRDVACGAIIIPPCLLAGMAILAYDLTLDTACLPFACLLRPLRDARALSRNDAFCFNTRRDSSLLIDSCCGVNITPKSNNCSQAYFDPQ